MAMTARPQDVEFFRRLLQSQETNNLDGGYTAPAWAGIRNQVPDSFKGLNSAMGLGDPEAGDPRQLFFSLLQSGKITPEEASMYMSKPNMGQTDWTASSELAKMLSGESFSRAAQHAGQSEDAIKGQVAGDLNRFGISDLSQIGVHTTSLGDTIFYNKLTGDKIPTRFGTDTSGEDQKKFGLVANPDGTVGIDVRTKTSSDMEDVRGVAKVLATIAAAGATDYLQYGSIGGGMNAAGNAGGVAFNSSLGPTTENAFNPVGSGLAGGENILGSGTYGLDSVASGTLGMSEGSLAAGGGITGLGGMSGSGPLALDTIISGTGPAAGAALGAASSSSPFTIGGKSIPTPSVPTPGGGGGGGDLIPLLTSLYGANDSSFTDKLEEIANRALERGDPFGPQRGYYQDRLRETYENPQAVYDRDYGALDKTFFNELMAQDAARGRSTDAYKRGVEREAKFQDWMLGNRSQLGGFAGANIDPSAMAGKYMEGMGETAAIQQMNRMAPINALGNFLGGSDGLQLGDITSGLSNLWNWGSNLFKG